MDRRSRKIFAMHGCLHTRSNAARLYLPNLPNLPCKEMGRGLIGIEKRERLNPYMATSEPR